MTPKDVMVAAIHWWGTQDETTKAAWDEKLGDSLPNRLRDMYVRWRDEWAEQRKHERPLGLEIFWKRSLPRPEEDRAWENGTPERGFDGLPMIDLLGYIDEVYWDAEKEMVVVRDNKSTSQMPKMTSLDDMMDSQLQLYSWGLTPQLFDRNLPKARMVGYDRALSTKPSTPKLNKSGTLSAQVKIFDERTYREWVANVGPVVDDDGEPMIDEGTGKQLVASRGQHYEGLKKDGSGAGVYEIDDKVIERITDEAFRRGFFQRTVKPVSQNIVRAHLRSALDSATDIYRTEKRIELTGEAARNLSRANCQYCDFQKLCRASMVGGPDGVYDLREYGLVPKSGDFEFSPLPLADVTNDHVLDI